jgi:glutamate synthase domain-containing protein 1
MLRCLVVKMSASVLKQVAHRLHKEANNDTIYGIGLLDPDSKKCMNSLANSSK